MLSNEEIVKLNNQRVLVIGDIILDRYIIGDVDKISPEAPVPILFQKEEFYKLGGAANVAANVASLTKNKVDLIGLSGNDIEKRIIEDLATTKNIRLFLDDSLDMTICKTRILSNDQQMLRVDKENTHVSSIITDRIANRIFELTYQNAYDVIIISDYAKGLITEETMNFIKISGIPVIVDPKPINKHLYSGVHLITPNYKEAKEMSLNGGNYEDISKELFEELKTNVVITLGSKGMCYRDSFDEIKTYKAETQEVFDVTGAGDTVISILALCVGAGIDMDIACEIANKAAGIVIAHMGTSVVTMEDLLGE